MPTSRGDNAGADLRRSKSLSSVQDRRKNPLLDKPLDPETARIHALIAAHRAVDRSHERTSTELGRSDSNASRNTNIRFSPAPFVRRGNSQRNSAQSHLMANLQREPRSVQYSTPDDLSQFGTSENYGAEPSSYRKLRQTKSLLVPKRQADGVSTHSALSKSPSLRYVASVSALAEPRLRVRLRRSLNFRSSQPNSPVTSESCREEAVRIAREQFLTNPPCQTSNKASYNSRVGREQKPFRQSVRTKPSIPISAEPELSQSPTQVKRRSISASIRDRFRRVFGRSNTKDVVPPQQLDAARSYYGPGTAIVGDCTSFDDYRVGQDSPSSRQSFYISTSPEHDALEDLDKISHDLRPTSRDSMHSNGRSRVTSWTNSTRTGSTALASAADWNRLSIIKEDGSPHQPSSSAGRHIGGLPRIPGSPAEETSTFAPINSQDMYSALIERLGRDVQEMTDTQTTKGVVQQRTPHDQFGHGTIRAVGPEEASIHAPDEEHRQFSLVSNPWQEGSGLTPEQQRQNLERRRQKLVEQEARTGFFPFVSKQKPGTQSPFRKLLKQKRKSSADLLNHTTNRSNAAVSSDSVYSRTTHGGWNSQFNQSTGSLVLENQPLPGPHGTATIIPAQTALRSHSSALSVRLPSSERAEWKGWIETQMSGLRRTTSKLTNNVQDNPGGDEPSLPASSLNQQRFHPTCDPKESTLRSSSVIKSENTPPHSSGLKRIQSRLLRKVSGNTLASFGDPLETGIDRSHRKISPTNLARMLKERKSSLFSTRSDIDAKRIAPNSDKGSPPLSTPGKLCFRVKEGDGSGRLRKKQSLALTDVSNRESRDARDKYGFDEESPTEKVKSTLSARLSRPFDMEVPGHNRPFDSTFLGKREAGFADPLTGDRLSVAKGAISRNYRGYGGLGTPPGWDKELAAQECTALPQLGGVDGSTAKSGSWVSKRMVSNFLRSRRKERTISEEAAATASIRASPAFV